MIANDTIAAISSAVGVGARMIVRLSGSEAHAIAGRVAEYSVEEGGRVVPVDLKFGGLRVPGQVYVFRAPRSYTGEDLVEFHLPGNPMLAKMLLGELLQRGARAAEAGEFTARAYFNGQIGLAEAEGVAAVIAAHNERELIAARQLLSGELARRLKPEMDQLADTLALVEVGIDFSEEDVTFLSTNEVADRVAQVDALLSALVAESARFESLSHEPVVVLVGRPNAGKSTLLNALAQQERAVVSPVEGTTRDAIWAHVALRHGLIRLVDVAGMSEEMPTDEISRQMQARARAAVESADFVLLVEDATDRRDRLALPRAADLIVRTKMDLVKGEAEDEDQGGDVSVVANRNMDQLADRLDQLVFAERGGGSGLALNVRHRRAIDDARTALARVADRSPELVALDLRDALDALGGILGMVSPDDLLGRVFSRFCIGK